MFSWLLDLLFPPKCVLCKSLLSREETDICHRCRQVTPEIEKPKFRLSFVAEWTALWYYKDDVRASLLRFKFGRKRNYALSYGRALAMHLQQKGFEKCDVLTYVPVSPLRKFRRSYDQVELIAGAVADELGLRLTPTLRKIRNTPPQSGFKDVSQRRANVLGAYRIKNSDLIRGKRILLLDDVITTGATASECARILLVAGAKEVYCAAMAAAHQDKNKVGEVMQFVSQDLGIDLGTSNVLIYAANQGITAREPSVVAVDKNSGKILQVGAAARNMLGRTPGNVVAMKPLTNGVVSDHEMTVKMLQHLIRSATNKSSLFTPKPRVIICVPSNITEVEERSVINAALEAGARRVYLIEEPLAAALGAGLDISGPKGHLVVDMGGGTTDIAVLSMNGVANATSLTIAGDHFDEIIARHIRRNHQVVIGQSTAEDIKIQIGSVLRRNEELFMEVKGKDSKSGRPRSIEVNSTEICGVLYRPALRIAEAVNAMLEDTSAELVGDLKETGIVLTGGSSQLWGMDMLLEKEVGIPCTIADDPAACVAYGCGKSLAWITRMTDGPVNIARKRLMRG